MKKHHVLYGLSATLLLGGCAGTSSTMSDAELAECLQPNRRVVVEVGGMVAKPPAKKPEAKPGDAPAPQKVAAAPPAKPAKPPMMAFSQALYVQGNSAFDAGSAVLKPEGQKEIDKMLAVVTKRAVNVGSVIVSGHTDRLEAASGNKTLAEERARAVKDYLVSKGINEKAVFWEGKDAREPVPVTKFCA